MDVENKPLGAEKATTTFLETSVALRPASEVGVPNSTKPRRRLLPLRTAEHVERALEKLSRRMELGEVEPEMAGKLIYAYVSLHRMKEGPAMLAKWQELQAKEAELEEMRKLGAPINGSAERIYD